MVIVRGTITKTWIRRARSEKPPSPLRKSGCGRKEIHPTRGLVITPTEVVKCNYQSTSRKPSPFKFLPMMRRHQVWLVRLVVAPRVQPARWSRLVQLAQCPRVWPAPAPAGPVSSSGSGGPKPDSQGSMTAKPTVKSNRQIGCSSQFAPARTTFTRL